MKKLVLLLVLAAFSVNAQIRVDKCKSYHADKQLAIQLFDSVNSYRNSLGETAFIWNDNYYESAKVHNDYLASSGLWGHTNKPVETELIVAVNNLKSNITPEIYNLIIDSCIRQWKHSEFHHKTMIAPARTKSKTEHVISITGIDLNITLCKYGAISVNIWEYDNYVHVVCIMQLGTDMIPIADQE